MCQLATRIFSNLGPPTNLLLQVTKDGVLDYWVSNPLMIGSGGLKNVLE